MRILNVEDDHKITGAVKRDPERQTYAVDLAYDVDDGLHKTTHKYNLVILDRMLPGGTDGIGILKEMRA